MKSTLSSEEKWKSIIDRTSELLRSDETFHSLNAKEKILAFYYYHFDVITDHRAFIIDQFLPISNAVIFCYRIRKYQKVFHKMIDPMIVEAIQDRLLRPLPIIDRSYSRFFWLQHLFILRYWTTDDSEGYDKSIALIEKSVRSSFDFMSNGEVRSSIDFWKFVLQNPIKIGMKYE